MRWWPLRRRPRRIDLMPSGGANGRERAAREALQAAERSAEATDALVRRVNWLTDEVERMLTIRPGGGSHGPARR